MLTILSVATVALVALEKHLDGSVKFAGSATSESPAEASTID